MIGQGSRPALSRATSKILCVSSVHEVIPWAGHVNYAASKGGVKMFMQIASPGAGAAPHSRELRGARRHPDYDQPRRLGDPQALQSLLTLIPYGRIGVPEDIAGGPPGSGSSPR